MKHRWIRLMTTAIVAAVALTTVIFMSSAAGSENYNEGFPLALMEKGRLDLRGWSPEIHDTLLLEGEWELYWQALLEPSDFRDGSLGQQAQYVQVPFIWKGDYEPELGFEVPAKTFATLRAVIKTDHQSLGMEIPIILTSSKVWVNGAPVAVNGSPDKSFESYIPAEASHVTEIRSDDGVYEIVIQAANHHLHTGGINIAMKLDSYETLHRRQILSLFTEALQAGIIFFMFIYHMIQFRYNREDKAPFYFALFCLGFVIRTFISGNKIILYLIPTISWIAVVRIAYLTFVPIIFFTQYIQYVFPQESNKHFVRWSTVLWIAYTLLALTFPEQWATPVMYIGEMMVLIMCAYLLVVLVSALRHGRKDVYPLLFAGLVMTIGILNDILFSLRIIHTGEIAVNGIILFMLSQSFIISARYSRALKESIFFSNEAKRVNMELIALNTELESKVQDRTSDMRTLLDNTGQGFLSFGEDLTVHADPSDACNQIFGEHVSGRPILSLLEDHVDSESYVIIRSALTKVFDESNEDRMGLYLSLIPKEIKIDHRTVILESELIRSGDDRDIMMILTDITEQKSIEKARDEERNNLRMVVFAVTNNADVVSELDMFERHFMPDLYDRLERATDPEAFLKDLYRLVHTYKGTFAQYQMKHTENHLHQLEEKICALQAELTDLTKAQLSEVLDAIDPKAMVVVDKQVLIDTLGKRFFADGDVVNVRTTVLEELEQDLIMTLNEEEAYELIGKLRRLRYQQVDRLLLSYDHYVQGLAINLEKQVDPLQISGDVVYLDYKRFHGFMKSLIHIFKNMIDHGIELPSEREALGKPEAGKILCRTARSDEDGLILMIGNDGSPIDSEQIRSKALAHKLFSKEALETMGEDQLHQLIFMDRFTTKKNVNRISGRGVGLGVVKRELAKLGGTIAVMSIEGSGTKFLIEVPYQEGMAWGESQWVTE